MFTLPDLPYKYDALEPWIDAETMRLHHTKHHQTYIDKLNQALQAAPELAGKSLEVLLVGLKDLPESIQTAVRNHGGGHANHSFFWLVMRPGQDNNLPSGPIADLLNQNFGDFDTFKKSFTDAGLAVFGSGWLWLVLDQDQKLKILKTANQDSPLTEGFKPILGLDLWEHAYYLKNQNRRGEYIENFFALINWEMVNKLLSENK